MNKGVLFVGIVAVPALVIGSIALYRSWHEVAYGPNSIDRDFISQAENGFDDIEAINPVTKDLTAGESANRSDSATELQTLNKSQIDELLAWKVRHGYADFHQDYGGLSEADLSSLAEAGEIGALHVLASRRAHKHPDKAIEYYREAAIHGSTYALILIGEIYMFHASDDGLIEGVNTQDDGTRKALAYNFAAQMLGDNATSPVQSKRLIETVLGEQLLDDSITGEICENAKSIYSDIEDARIENGFLPHDNSVAPYSEPVDSLVSVNSFCTADI